MHSALTIAFILGMATPAQAAPAIVDPAVYTDPALDSAHPAKMAVVHIPSGDVAINGVVYVAAGPGSHPVVVLCHGLPGNEKNLDLAQAIRRAGWTVITFNYRGSWGSPGSYSFANDLADVDAVLAYARDPANAAKLGLDPDDARKVLIVGGAGIDPDAYAPVASPVGPTLRVAMVARMLWSKGADLAVEAVRLAQAKGADVTLSLYGAPDGSNPRAISEEMLLRWSTQPGIRWHGPTGEVAAVWANHHLAILPSRGGEGLPRTILEAAACGRAILTTDVPGCRDFVRDGIEGRVVANDDVDALAAALVALAGHFAELATMGAAARARVLDGHTETAVGQDVLTLYGKMLR